MKCTSKTAVVDPKEANLLVGLWSNMYGCVFWGKSQNGSLVLDHLNHGASKEAENPSPEWIHRFLWCTVIQVILDQCQSQNQKNAPIVMQISSSSITTKLAFTTTWHSYMSLPLGRLNTFLTLDGYCRIHWATQGLHMQIRGMLLYSGTDNNSSFCYSVT